MIEQNINTIGDIKEFIKHLSSDLKVKCQISFVDGQAFNVWPKMLTDDKGNNPFIIVEHTELRSPDDIGKYVQGQELTDQMELKRLTEQFLMSLIRESEYDETSNKALINVAEQMAQDFMNHKFETNV